MLEKQVVFHTNFLKKTAIIRINESHVLCSALIDKRRGVKTNFKTKKKKVIFITPADIKPDDFFCNLNMTVYKSHQTMEEVKTLKKHPHALRRKIK